MRYLLDECLSELVARTMSVLGSPDEFVYLLDVAPRSTADPDIPAICRRESFDVLVTINVKDFGARKHIYEAVIEAGIHVLVLRPRKQAPTHYWQTGLLSQHYPKYSKLFRDASEATLGSMTDSGVRPLTLDAIMHEITAQETGRTALP